ncbi:MAG: hypothetical protein AVDCRST_MAG96-267 [uncultured Segetibacter sp.]|uniref:Uncharacterized protein n=1 Tax=uncultured Segetibacter sp. TaxID=481133 RepID=A0A6J4RL77_9BACT|nr:MAG: hypothetical protein AVDCRST_MAG96-267 [uncultured Segetibacter sp.]
MKAEKSRCSWLKDKHGLNSGCRPLCFWGADDKPGSFKAGHVTQALMQVNKPRHTAAKQAYDQQ